MIRRMLSGDLPRSRVLMAVLILLVVGLALTPFLFPGAKALNVGAKIMIFIVLVASFDLLLGYTGIVSFAHTMFFGIGAYGVAIALSNMEPGWKAVGVGVACALAASLVLSLVIGLFSLRVKAMYYAMITLAVATAFMTLASQLSEYTGGEDGLSFKAPRILMPSFQLSEHTIMGVSLDGKIVSFAHTMFFGIGAYGVAIALTVLGPAWPAVAAGVAGALALTLVLSLVIGLFSLRVKAIFYAMITLAVATAFQTLASQLSDFTGGEDGLSFKVPEWLTPGFSLSDTPFLGAALNGKLISYYLVFAVTVALFLIMLRIVNSPFGRVLQAIRENPFRAEALGYRTVVYRTCSNMLSAGFASLAGALLALWLRYNGPDTSLSFQIMISILLMVVIGGMGTLYGAVVGATLFLIVENYLQDLLKLANHAASGVPVLRDLFLPDRWLMWLGLLFILSVYRFPSGIVGKLRTRTKRA